MSHTPIHMEFPLIGPEKIHIHWSKTEVSLYTADASSTPQSHDNHEIYIHVYGDVSLEVEGRVYLLSPGDIVIIPPYTSHRHINSHTRSSLHYSLHIPQDVRSEFFRCLFPAEPLRHLAPDTALRRRLTNTCVSIDELCALPDASPTRTLAVLASLLCLIEEIQAAGHILEPTSPSPSLAAILRGLDNSFAARQSVQFIAERAHLSTVSLAKLFRDELSTTPNAYIQGLRLRKAKELLRGDTEIAEISSLCGFSDYSHFIARFRRIYGITPKKYRQYMHLLQSSEE